LTEAGASLLRQKTTIDNGEKVTAQFINLKKKKKGEREREEESPAELLDLFELFYNTIARGYKWFFYS
jgi:hypothetical protein